MTEFLNIDMPRCDRDTALELMVHHLQLAHAYFQITSDNAEEKAAEVTRIFKQQNQPIRRWKDDGGLGYAEEVQIDHDLPETVAGLVWLSTLEAWYEKLRQEQGD